MLCVMCIDQILQTSQSAIMRSLCAGLNALTRAPQPREVSLMLAADWLSCLIPGLWLAYNDLTRALMAHCPGRDLSQAGVSYDGH